MLSELTLELELDRPLVYAYAGSSTEALLLLGALPALLKNDIAVIAVVPTADAAALDRLAGDYPSDLVRLKDEREPARRRALSAADFALASTPARSTRAPSRLRALLSRPVALAGPVDALVDCDSELETGTGFLLTGRDGGARGPPRVRFGVRAPGQPVCAPGERRDSVERVPPLRSSLSQSAGSQ